MARLRHTTGLRSTNPMYGVFRAVKPRIGNRCTASGDLCTRISAINRVLFSYCFRQFLRFRSDTHCFDESAALGRCGCRGLGAGKTSGAGTRGVSLDVVIGCRTGHSDTNGGESSDNRSKVHADCGPAENPSL